MIPQKRADIVAELQSDILRIQGFKPASFKQLCAGLGPIKSAFPNDIFPLGAVHEFLAEHSEDSAATSGFIAGLLAPLMSHRGCALWISSSPKIFPPALKSFGLEPDRIIFIHLRKEQDVLWAMDEALKCGALTAVVAEMEELSFTNSRRLQLAVEHSQVTGFVIRKPRKLNTTACVSRWKITSLPSHALEGLPGIGFPQWKVELLRVRNGTIGVWDVRWMDGKFISVVSSRSGQSIPSPQEEQFIQRVKAG